MSYSQAVPYSDQKERLLYQRAYQAEWQRSHRMKWMEDNGPCRHCGSWDDLELDHIDPSTKVSNSVWSWSEVRRNEELAKCQPLCKRCHKAKTLLQTSIPLDLHHGTYSCWKKKKCRCDRCVSAQREYKRDYRARGGAH